MKLANVMIFDGISSFSFMHGMELRRTIKSKTSFKEDETERKLMGLLLVCFYRKIKLNYKIRAKIKKSG